MGLTFILYLGFGGTVPLTPLTILHELFHPGTGTPENNIVWDLRLPLACACLVVGAILGLAGSAFQALFQNPLAEPYVVGVSAGSAVGGALALVTGFGAAWGGPLFNMGRMIAAFPAGLLALGLVFLLARRRGVVNVQSLLLAGVAVGALLGSLLSLVLLAGGKDTRVVLQWLWGNLDSASWNEIGVMLAVLLIGGAVLIRSSRNLNAFALGEQTAQRLGVDVARLKPAVLVTGTAMVAATVGSVGIIAFLGLVAPHIARKLIGVDWRWSLIASGLLGAAIMLAADFLGHRAIPAAGVVPDGIVTAVIGAPFLLALLRKE